MSSNKQVTIIVPVYGDWPSLKECIESLIEYVDNTAHKVILVNDCGPEADAIEAHIKKMISGLSNFFYFLNKKNLGFLQNCNNAVLNLDGTSNDVLLLNSDAKLTKGALDEMVSVLNSDEKIGAVSPRSNNATICTVPLSSAPQKGIGAKPSYRLYGKMKDVLPQYTVAPTAHGFCMLIRRSLINEIGLFDEVFGKGYGEEVDFCQRARKKGYKCVIANHAFVFHQEARSFSMETKSKLLEVNNKVIWERWPKYRDEVHEYMTTQLEFEKPVELSSGYGVDKKLGIINKLKQNKVIRAIFSKQ